MLIRQVVQSSSRSAIEDAPAFAMDFGAVEAGGREEGGIIQSMARNLREATQKVLSCRIIRRVQGDSKYGNVGDVVDTTEKDHELAQSVDYNCPIHWYLGAELSPGVLVVELSPEAISSGINLSAFGVLIKNMDPMALELLRVSGYATAALREAGMDPKDIWDYMEERRINSRNPVMG